MPPNISPAAGIPTTPSTGRPLRTRPIFTANSSLPAANSRVPSSGSTSQNSADGSVMRPAATSSSAITGISGAAFAQARDDDRLGGMIRLGHRRAVLLADTSKPRARTARIAAPASIASSLRARSARHRSCIAHTGRHRAGNVPTATRFRFGGEPCQGSADGGRSAVDARLRLRFGVPRARRLLRRSRRRPRLRVGHSAERSGCRFATRDGLCWRRDDLAVPPRPALR